MRTRVYALAALAALIFVNAVAAPTPAPAPSPDLSAALTDALLHQPRDRPWAEAVERDLADTLAAVSADAALGPVDCRRTMCRVEVIYEGSAHPDRFLERLTAAPPWSADRWIQSPGPGGVEIVVWLAREGHRLPTSGVN